MAFFYGALQGARGEATRLGSKNSGLTTVAASWQGAVRTCLYVDADGVTKARVNLTPWHGAGVNLELYDGPIAPGM